MMDPQVDMVVMITLALCFVGVMLCGVSSRLPGWVRQLSMAVCVVAMVYWLDLQADLHYIQATVERWLIFGLGIVTSLSYAWQQLRRPRLLIDSRAASAVIFSVILFYWMIFTYTDRSYKFGRVSSLIDILINAYAPIVLALLVVVVTHRHIREANARGRDT